MFEQGAGDQAKMVPLAASRRYGSDPTRFFPIAECAATALELSQSQIAPDDCRFPDLHD